MNRQKLLQIAWTIYAIAFPVIFGLVIHFQIFLPVTSNVYEKLLDYSETLYEEYQKEVERMIIDKEYTCKKYPAEATFYSKEGQPHTLVIKIGEYEEGNGWSDYITATVTNFGNKEQKITFERSRDAEDAEEYRAQMKRVTIGFVFMLAVFTAWLIKNAIKKRYNVMVVSVIVLVVVSIAILVLYAKMMDISNNF